jgi:GntR family transcriptional regulator / MocR family aminotransferase
MAKSAKGALLSQIEMDRNAPITLFQQLDRALRKLILNGTLGAGQQLPSTRQLAHDIEVSRITVKNVYEQLIAEGYIYSRSGSGTFVADDLAPDTYRQIRRSRKRRRTSGFVLPDQCRHIARSKSSTRQGETRPFRPGVPAMDVFPTRIWSKYWADAITQGTDADFGYGPAGGSPRLKAAIAAHLKDARGVICDPEQVVLTSGSQQAFVLIALTLLNRGDTVWYENPGHIAGRDAMQLMGAKIYPTPIDKEGIDVSFAQENHPKAALIFTTPSHQHPLGNTMSLIRRLALLAYAQENRTWVIEDDYDSEFRFKGQPLPALQAMDNLGSVLYVGTFSKSIYPAIRLGYVIVPHALVDVFCEGQGLLGQGASALTQSVVARFIEEGRLSEHIRKLRNVFRKRRDILMDELLSQCQGVLEPVPTEAGMHLIAWLNEGVEDTRAHAALLQAGVDSLPVSVYNLLPDQRSGLVLGFSGAKPGEIPDLVNRMNRCLRGLNA